MAVGCSVASCSHPRVFKHRFTLHIIGYPCSRRAVGDPLVFAMATSTATCAHICTVSVCNNSSCRLQQYSRAMYLLLPSRVPLCSGQSSGFGLLTRKQVHLPRYRLLTFSLLTRLTALFCTQNLLALSTSSCAASCFLWSWGSVKPGLVPCMCDSCMRSPRRCVREWEGTRGQWRGQLKMKVTALVGLLLVAALQPSAGFVGAGLSRPRGISHRSSQSRVAVFPEPDAADDSWVAAGAGKVPNDPSELQVRDV